MKRSTVLASGPALATALALSEAANTGDSSGLVDAIHDHKSSQEREFQS